MSNINHPGPKISSIVLLAVIATIQALLLHHELVDCYPYKVMDLHDQARLAAMVAAFAGPIGAVLISLRVLWFKSLWQVGTGISILAGLTVPLAFFLAYTTLTFHLSVAPSSTEFTPEVARLALQHAATTNVIWGFLAGIILNAILFIPQIGAARLRA